MKELIYGIECASLYTLFSFLLPLLLAFGLWKIETEKM